MIVFLCSGCQGSIKKAAMKVAHDNGVDIVTGGSGNLAGSGEKLEGSFAELLLRPGIGVRDQRLSFACGVFFRLLPSLALSLNGTKPISLLQSAVGWGGQNLPTGI